MDSEKTYRTGSDAQGSGRWLSLSGNKAGELGEDLPRWRQWARRGSDLLCGALESNLILTGLGLITLTAGLLLAVLAGRPEWMPRIPSTTQKVAESKPQSATTFTVSQLLAAGIPTLGNDELILESEVPEVEAQTTTERFFVRVASFRNPENAERLINSLQQTTERVREEIFSDGLHVVVMGPFEDKDTAQTAAQIVEKRSGLAPQVVQRDGR